MTESTCEQHSEIWCVCPLSKIYSYSSYYYLCLSRKKKKNNFVVQFLLTHGFTWWESKPYSIYIQLQHLHIMLKMGGGGGRREGEWRHCSLWQPATHSWCAGILGGEPLLPKTLSLGTPSKEDLPTSTSKEVLHTPCFLTEPWDWKTVIITNVPSKLQHNK